MDKPKGHIMIVDDDPHAVEILTRMLGREGYTCVGAAGGRIALDKLKEEAVDVILLDVMMPEMDGLQVCQHLRDNETWREIPVILVTAKDDIETRSRGMVLGVSEYVTKPINKRELFTRIQAQLHARSIGKDLTKVVVDPGNPGEIG